MTTFAETDLLSNWERTMSVWKNRYQSFYLLNSLYHQRTLRIIRTLISKYIQTDTCGLSWFPSSDTKSNHVQGKKKLEWTLWMWLFMVRTKLICMMDWCERSWWNVESLLMDAKKEVRDGRTENVLRCSEDSEWKRYAYNAYIADWARIAI